MDIAKYAIEKPINIWLIIILLIGGGLFGLNSVGQLEDPAFTIKQVKVNTAFPGANAEQVELEVTEQLETVIQQMPQLKRLTSVSKPGMSEITVEVKDHFKGPALTQIWDELRKKIRDAEGDLPKGVRTPRVIDDFGDVYGLYFALTAEGYEPEVLREFSRLIRRELLTVPGVSKVSIAGIQDQEVVAKIDYAKLVQLGISFPEIKQAIDLGIRPFSEGRMVVDGQKVRIPVAQGANPVSQLENLKLAVPGQTAQLTLSDIAEITLREAPYPKQVIRHNGQAAATLAVSVSSDENVVIVGQAVEYVMDKILQKLPAGIELQPIYNQAKIVDESISGFLLNLAMSVAVVGLTLFIFMGVRAGIVVSSILVLSVIGSLLFMWMMEINMQRISLGAMVIAMGMLVDNAIVVAEGMMIRMQQGKSAQEAANYVIKRTAWPLLGATVIGIAAFSGIGLSNNATGEFLFSLFAVIMITLLLSWILAILVAPLFGHYFFKQGDGPTQDVYDGLGYRFYKAILIQAIRFKWITVLFMLAITVASYMSFGMVKQSFFPPSNTPMFFIHYWGDQTRDINTTIEYAKKAEQLILQNEQVVNVSTFIGAGPERYTLTAAPEAPNESYSFFMIRTENRDVIDALAQKLQADIQAQDLGAAVYTNRIFFGPPTGAQLEARFLGEDATVLRNLAEQAQGIFEADGDIRDIRHNWRQKMMVLKPEYDDYTAGVAGISRADFSDAIQFATSGLTVGNLQVRENRYPVVLQAQIDENTLESESLNNAQVWSQVERSYVPIRQLTTSMQLEAEDALIHRRDRIRSISVYGEPAVGETANEALFRIKAQVEAIPLPDGYRLEWGGEFQASSEAQESLGAALPLGFLVMFIISVLLFGKARPPLIIWLIVPMAVTGVVIGLLSADMAFGFMALLGFLSLFGMLIKNAIVLLEEIDLQEKEKGDHYQALVSASISRLRPVLLAAITTILGMLPLLSDAFFANMAVTIMGGLAFATVLTMIAVPALYAVFYGIKHQKP